MSLPSSIVHPSEPVDARLTLCVPRALVDIRDAGGFSTIALCGELDVATVPGLAQAVDTSLTRGRKRILVDMAQVTFMDAFALGVLMTVLHRVSRAGGSLVVTPNPVLDRLLGLIGLVDQFTVKSADRAFLDGRASPVLAT